MAFLRSKCHLYRGKLGLMKSQKLMKGLSHYVNSLQINTNQRLRTYVKVLIIGWVLGEKIKSFKKFDISLSVLTNLSRDSQGQHNFSRPVSPSYIAAWWMPRKSESHVVRGQQRCFLILLLITSERRPVHFKFDAKAPISGFSYYLCWVIIAGEHLLVASCPGKSS
jgi:hypothetical protein